MAGHAGDGAASSAPLLAALAETGAIGSTARQLADRMARPLPAVARGLEALSEKGRVLQIGRGLWILRDFERLDGHTGFVDPASYTERFVAEGGVALGRYRGGITFSDNDAAPVHRWWPYVQGYSAEFVWDLLQRSDLSRDALVFDPFSGSGTTAVEARRAGFRALGVELLPPAVLAAQVKTHFELRTDRLRVAADRVLRSARKRPTGTLPFLRETPQHFAPSVLADLTRLRDSLPEATTPEGRAVRIAFGRILIPVSRLRRSPCLGYGGPEPARPPDAFQEFERAISEMESDLGALATRRASWGASVEIRETDARSARLPRGRVGLAVTSPPYVNGMDYVMNYKLDLAWLGYARSYADLVALRRAMVACDNLPRGAADDFLSIDDAPDPWLPAILGQIRSNVASKATYRRNDVHGIVKRYFADLLPVLRRVHDALVPGGRFVLVVGDSLLAGAYVPGDLILARIGASVGFSIDSVEIARARRSGQRRSFVLRESIVTLRKPRSAA
jgi:SAM-dependent methyltransferase